MAIAAPEITTEHQNPSAVQAALLQLSDRPDDISAYLQNRLGADLEHHVQIDVRALHEVLNQADVRSENPRLEHTKLDQIVSQLKKENPKVLEQFLDVAYRVWHSPEQRAQLFSLFEKRCAAQDGKLLAFTVDDFGQTLLDNLSRLALHTKPTTDGTVLSGLLENITNPLRENQGEKNTCSGAETEFTLLKTKPAELTRILLEAETKGTVTNRDGIKIQVSKELLIEAAKEDAAGNGKYDRRNRAEREFQAIYADCGTNTYYPSKDCTVLPAGFSHQGPYGFVTQSEKGCEYKGLHDDEIQARHWFFVEKAERIDAKENWAEKNRAMQIIDDAVGSDQPVTAEDLLAAKTGVKVSLAWNREGQQHAFHVLTVLRADQEFVYLRNPWGQGAGHDGIYKMPREEFMASLRWAMNRDQNAKLQGNPTYTSEKAVRATSVIFEAEFEGGPIIAPYQPLSMQVVNLDALALKNMIQQQLEKGVAEVTTREKKETTGPGNAASRRRPPVATKVKNPNAFTTDDDDLV